MKIKRDAFLYYDGTTRDFAQCGSCWLFASNLKRCAVIPGIEVRKEDSCGYWGGGEFNNLGVNRVGLPRFKPEEVGFVKRQVRCENCAHFDAERSICYLFETLNRDHPVEFELETKVKPKGCCNAQVPKE